MVGMRSDRPPLALVAGLLLGVLALALGIALALPPHAGSSAPDGGDSRSGTVTEPAPRWAEPASLPPSAPQPTRAGVAGLPDADWIAAVSARTGIPARALAAYAGAAISKHAERPDCELGWNTLAGIGWVESRHASHGGASIAADGAVRPPIIGIALDGSRATQSIPDSDDGAIDGDAETDRAVGPMQFIPQTWANWFVDGSGDGAADPHNIDDQALAAANYLCRITPTLADERSWRAGIAGYNPAGFYLAEVARAAERYGEVGAEVAGAASG